MQTPSIGRCRKLVLEGARLLFSRLGIVTGVQESTCSSEQKGLSSWFVWSSPSSSSLPSSSLQTTKRTSYVVQLHHFVAYHLLTSTVSSLVILIFLVNNDFHSTLPHCDVSTRRHYSRHFLLIAFWYWFDLTRFSWIVIRPILSPHCLQIATVVFTACSHEISFNWLFFCTGLLDIFPWIVP
jgi:hypothetical protein